ncbi:hypothetical protein LK12_00230 [Novosphingobium malaysiense]|uniref:Uncharacterized protein n=1 Tax=Novosphingobium malaysiense TaxID=1348853 RepID=A0A0B1ZW15_9SPHN|nr:hypothetical protein LK12_00230 [Novosphingobium malaysiense]
MRSRTVAAALAAALLLPLPANAGAPTISVSEANSELTDGYRLATGDKLKVTVFDEPTLSGEYEVGVDGDLALPLLDPIPAAGKTPKALATIIADKLESGEYVLVPRVSVEIIEHRPFYILGEVNKPGQYAYSGEITFEQAVAQAGGFTARANKGTIYLRRQDWGSKRRVKLEGQPLKLAPGDTIEVREAFF